MMRITATALSLVLGCASSTAAAQQREALATSRSPRVLAGILLLQVLRIRRWILARLGRR